MDRGLSRPVLTGFAHPRRTEREPGGEVKKARVRIYSRIREKFRILRKRAQCIASLRMEYCRDTALPCPLVHFSDIDREKCRRHRAVESVVFCRGGSVTLPRAGLRPAPTPVLLWHDVGK